MQTELELSTTTLVAEQAESVRLRNEMVKYKQMYQDECMKRSNALQESRDVQALNVTLVKEHKEMLTLSQTSSNKSSDDQDKHDKHVQELEGSVRSLKAQHSDALHIRELLLNQTQQELTDQIMKERKRTKLLFSASVFWRTTDDMLYNGGTEETAAKSTATTSVVPSNITDSLELTFLSVLREGQLHLMFVRHTSGALFTSAGGGLKGRDRLYIAALPRRDQTTGEGVHQCVLSDESVGHIESAQVTLTNVIVANVVELRGIDVGEGIQVFVATAGEIFHPKLY